MNNSSVITKFGPLSPSRRTASIEPFLERHPGLIDAACLAAFVPFVVIGMIVSLWDTCFSRPSRWDSLG
ncbi:MAG TPA: hypothetical protein VGY31_00550 [Terriglobia bacterium]|nr:hypothetical protein [Terriglobia bacterium]